MSSPAAVRSRMRPSIAAWMPDESSVLTNAPADATFDIEGALADLPPEPIFNEDLQPGDEDDMFGHKAAEAKLRELRANRPPLRPRAAPALKRVEAPVDLSSGSIEPSSPQKSVTPAASRSPSPVKAKRGKGKGKKREQEESKMLTEDLMDLLPRARKRERVSYREREDSEDAQEGSDAENAPAARNRRRRPARDTLSSEISEDEIVAKERKKRIRGYKALPDLKVELIV